MRSGRGKGTIVVSISRQLIEGFLRTGNEMLRTRVLKGIPEDAVLICIQSGEFDTFELLFETGTVSELAVEYQVIELMSFDDRAALLEGRVVQLNPNHPVALMTRDSWHKIVAVLMLKFDLEEIEITEADVSALGDAEKAVVADCRDGKFVIRILRMEDALALAKHEGGLPV